MLIYYGVLSLYCFLASISSSLILLFQFINIRAYSFCIEWLYWILIEYYIALNILICIFLKSFAYQVAVRALFLGFIFCLGIFISVLAEPSWNLFGWYMCIMSFFHYSEFFTISATNPRTLTISSYILNHSIQYQIAAVSSWVEFFVEMWFFPEIKRLQWVSVIGLTLCIIGEIIRKLSMFTARANFNHIVQSVRNEGHVLVTHGIYSVFRHPSYVGWFYWSIGTQLVLLNPVCIIGYTLASWKFFQERIIIEEMTLISFFGQEYLNYQKRVPTGLCFIEGYTIDTDSNPQQDNFQN